MLPGMKRKQASIVFMITAFVWVVALVRFPELTQRILGKSNA
jgi:hypothetical protein